MSGLGPLGEGMFGEKGQLEWGVESGLLLLRSTARKSSQSCLREAGLVLGGWANGEHSKRLWQRWECVLCLSPSVLPEPAESGEAQRGAVEPRAVSGQRRAGMSEQTFTRGKVQWQFFTEP